MAIKLSKEERSEVFSRANDDDAVGAVAGIVLLVGWLYFVRPWSVDLIRDRRLIETSEARQPDDRGRRRPAAPLGYAVA